MGGNLDNATPIHNANRTSLIDRLKTEKCEICGATGKLDMHHVRKLKALDGKDLIENFNADLTSRCKLTLKDADGNHTCVGLQIDGTLNRGAKALVDRLHEIDRTAGTDGAYQKIGTLGNFSIFVRTEQYEREKVISFNNTFSIGYAGCVKYTHNNGTMPHDDALAVVSFSKALDKIEGLIKKSEKTVAEITANIPTYRRIVNSPFSKDVELQALKVERDVLDRKIQLTLKPIREATAQEDAGRDKAHDEARAFIDSHIIVAGVPQVSAGRRV